MEFIAICKMLFKDLQLHIFGVLLLSYRAYARMDKRHEVDSATSSLKFEHIDKSIDGLKQIVETGKKDTDKKIDEINKKVDDNVLHLQEKWRHYTSGNVKKEASIEKEAVIRQ